MTGAEFTRAQAQLTLLMPAMLRMQLEQYVEALERGCIAGGVPADYGIIGDKMMADVRAQLDVARAALSFQRAIKHYRPDVVVQMNAEAAGAGKIPSL